MKPPKLLHPTYWEPLLRDCEKDHHSWMFLKTLDFKKWGEIIHPNQKFIKLRSYASQKLQQVPETDRIHRTCSSPIIQKQRGLLWDTHRQGNIHRRDWDQLSCLEKKDIVNLLSCVQFVQCSLGLQF